MLDIARSIRKLYEANHVQRAMHSYLDKPVDFNKIQPLIEEIFPNPIFKKYKIKDLDIKIGSLKGASSLFQVVEKKENNNSIFIPQIVIDKHAICSLDEKNNYKINQCWYNFFIINELFHYAFFLRNGLLHLSYDEITSKKNLFSLRQRKSIVQYATELNNLDNLSTEMLNEYHATIATLELLLPRPVRKYILSEKKQPNRNDISKEYANFYKVPLFLLEGSHDESYLCFIANKFCIYRDISKSDKNQEKYKQNYEKNIKSKFTTPQLELTN